ncbi:PREDICTED: PX domain-containing protein 1 isoform X2 [Hipposideros armiger]|uniref:PX domain-containing protein 1 isoform X2 n=1 Tax=Hipposideros armiger TaxID=186990 RepID=A0A8B7TEB7_HIPAR|nr:PREDICTED: PX domain-containing protein 1 isoform X2 [Hipposideros armiger]
MASAVFEGTSLVNMFVRGCWVNGIRRLIVSRRGDEEEFFEIRTEWSDRSVLYLHRSFADLGRLWQRLRDAFPEDRPELARAPLRQGLIAIKDAHDIETRLNEVEKLLKIIISMPCKKPTGLAEGLRRGHVGAKGSVGISTGRWPLNDIRKLRVQ